MTYGDMMPCDFWGPPTQIERSFILMAHWKRAMRWRAELFEAENKLRDAIMEMGAMKLTV